LETSKFVFTPLTPNLPILPPSLVDLEPSSEKESDVEEETDQELGFSEVFNCDEDDRSTLTSKSFYVKSFYWRAHILAKSMNSQKQHVHLRGKKCKISCRIQQINVCFGKSE